MREDLRETRAAALLHHVNLATKHSAFTFRAYASQVRDAYEARTPAAARTIAFHTTRDPYADERANAQILRRLFEEKHGVPCAIEEALVLALPPPFQGECRRELAARLGELAAPMPADAHGAAVADAGALMKETGEVLTEVSQCFIGNEVPPDKRGIALRAIGEIDGMIASAVSIKTRLADAVGLLNPVVPLTKKAG